MKPSHTRIALRLSGIAAAWITLIVLTSYQTTFQRLAREEQAWARQDNRICREREQAAKADSHYSLDDRLLFEARQRTRAASDKVLDAADRLVAVADGEWLPRLITAARWVGSFIAAVLVLVAVRPADPHRAVAASLSARHATR